MVKLPFNANTEKFEWETMFSDPKECAQHLWDQSITYDCFDNACEVAAVDQEVYDELTKWAREQADMTDHMKARLFEALVISPRPPKKLSVTEKKNHLIRWIANQLMSAYGLNLMRNQEPSPSSIRAHSAASVLATVKGLPSEGTIHGILTVKKNKK